MSFLNTSNKRIGGKLSNIKEIFTIEEADGSQYKIDTFEDIIGPSRRDNCLTTLYNNTLSISRIKVEVYQNNVFVYLNGSSTPTFKTTDNSDNKFIIIKVGNSDNVIITYFDHNIGTNNNTYVENNVISCNYNDRNEIVNETVSPSGSQLLTIYKMTSYAEITRYLSVDGKSFTDRLPYNKSFEEKSHLFINKDDRKFGVISEDLSKVNNVEIEYDNDIDVGSNPIFIEESNFNNSDEFYTVDGNFKPHTLTFIDNANNSININYNYRIYNNSQNYKGKVSFNFYDSNNSNVLSFDLFINKSSNMLKIDNVFISDNIKNNVLTNNLSSNTIVNNLENYDFGFAINFYSGNLELSVKTNKKGTILLFSKVVIDYSNMNLPSALEKVTFNSSKTYAIRENNNNGYTNDLYKEFKFTGITANYNYRLFRSDINFTARVEIYKSNVKKLSFDIDVINNETNIYNVDNRINYYQNYINGDMKMGMGISLFSYQNFIGLCVNNIAYIDTIVVRYGEANGKNPIHFEKVSYSTTGEMRIVDQDEFRGINYTNSRVNSEASSRSSADATLQSNINTLSNNTAANLTNLENRVNTKFLDSLPIGTIIPLFKTTAINSRITNYYLKCDGSLIPSNSVYNDLRNLLIGSSSNNSFSLNQNSTPLSFFDNFGVNSENNLRVFDKKEAFELVFSRYNMSLNGFSLNLFKPLDLFYGTWFYDSDSYNGINNTGNYINTVFSQTTGVNAGIAIYGTTRTVNSSQCGMPGCAYRLYVICLVNLSDYSIYNEGKSIKVWVPMFNYSNRTNSSNNFKFLFNAFNMSNREPNIEKIFVSNLIGSTYKGINYSSIKYFADSFGYYVDSNNFNNNKVYYLSSRLNSIYYANTANTFYNSYSSGNIYTRSCLVTDRIDTWAKAYVSSNTTSSFRYDFSVNGTWKGQADIPKSYKAFEIVLTAYISGIGYVNLILLRMYRGNEGSIYGNAEASDITSGAGLIDYNMEYQNNEPNHVDTYGYRIIDMLNLIYGDRITSSTSISSVYIRVNGTTSSNHLTNSTFMFTRYIDPLIYGNIETYKGEVLFTNNNITGGIDYNKNNRTIVANELYGSCIIYPLENDLVKNNGHLFNFKLLFYTKTMNYNTANKYFPVKISNSASGSKNSLKNNLEFFYSSYNNGFLYNNYVTKQETYDNTAYNQNKVNFYTIANRYKVPASIMDKTCGIYSTSLYSNFNTFWDTMAKYLLNIDSSNSFKYVPEIGNIPLSEFKYVNSSGNSIPEFNNRYNFIYSSVIAWGRNVSYSLSGTRYNFARNIFIINNNRLKSHVIEVQQENDSNNRNKNEGLIMFQHDRWVPLGYVLKNSNINSDAVTWSFGDPAGVIRIRVISSKTGKIFLDQYFVEFDSTKNWIFNLSYTDHEETDGRDNLNFADTIIGKQTFDTSDGSDEELAIIFDRSYTSKDNLNSGNEFKCLNMYLYLNYLSSGKMYGLDRYIGYKEAYNSNCTSVYNDISRCMPRNAAFDVITLFYLFKKYDKGFRKNINDFGNYFYNIGYNGDSYNYSSADKNKRIWIKLYKQSSSARSICNKFAIFREGSYWLTYNANQSANTVGNCSDSWHYRNYDSLCLIAKVTISNTSNIRQLCQYIYIPLVINNTVSGLNSNSGISNSDNKKTDLGISFGLATNKNINVEQTVLDVSSIFVYYNNLPNELKIEGINRLNLEDVEQFTIHERYWNGNSSSYFVPNFRNVSSDYSRLVNSSSSNTTNNNVYLPDLTEEGIFIGGGNNAGYKLDWTVPNISGSFSPGKNNTSPDGVFTQNFDRSGEDGSNGNGFRVTFDLNNLSTYANHTNKLDNFYPKHYNVDFYIKYK